MIKVILHPQVLLEMKHKNDYVVELGGVISASGKHMLGLLSSQGSHHRITVCAMAISLGLPFFNGKTFRITGSPLENYVLSCDCLAPN
jgi:hypothetical protein